MVSSSLKSIGFDATEDILEIEFHHGGVYRYLHVPLNVYKELLSAESKGPILFDEHSRCI